MSRVPYLLGGTSWAHCQWSPEEGEGRGRRKYGVRILGNHFEGRGWPLVLLLFVEGKESILSLAKKHTLSAWRLPSDSLVSSDS